MRETAETGAASVASRLLAFYREPVRHRPGFIHGREVLAGGHFVFRFAQGRFPQLLARDLAPRELAELREAAEAFIRQVCLWDGATHYQLLCLAPDARREAIKRHYQLLIALIHPDRAHKALAPWPSGSAPRINRAYEVLSDERLRGEYDRGLMKLEGETRYPRQPLRPADASRSAMTGPAARIGPAKTLGVVTAVVVPLLFLQVWWVADLPQEHSLANGTPSSALRWLRDASPGAERPRFLGGAASPLRAPDAEAAIEPQTSSRTIHWPAPLARRDPEPLDAEPALADKPKVSDPVQSAAMAPAAPQQEAAAAVAQAPPAAPPPVAPIARPMPTRPPEANAISAKEIESIVARLVSSYEAGDADRLMSLFDAAGAGMWRTAVIRQEYHDFFRATRQRRLRVHHLEWRTAQRSAQAKGEATLLAEYFDEPSRLERKVDIEIDIALRDGQAMITRVSLFPHGN